MDECNSVLNVTQAKYTRAIFSNWRNSSVSCVQHDGAVVAAAAAAANAASTMT